MVAPHATAQLEHSTLYISSGFTTKCNPYSPIKGTNNLKGHWGLMVTLGFTLTAATTQPLREARDHSPFGAQVHFMLYIPGQHSHPRLAHSQAPSH